MEANAVKVMLMISAVLAMTMLVSFAKDKVACAQEGCCCQLVDGSTCCTYDLNCLGCPCAL